MRHTRMHIWNDETEALAQAIERYARDRMRLDPPPLDGPKPASELQERVGQTVTPEGLGPLEALRVFREELAPACISVDHPMFTAFVPAAPTEAAMLFDLVVGASSICGVSWLEAAGAVYAENQALRWLADLAGLPPEAGGCFVSGGSSGNLSGLVAARDRAKRERSDRPARWMIAAGDDAHSSIRSAAKVMDVEVITASSDERGRLTGEALARTLDAGEADGLFAVVATAGTTNLGIVDDLAGVADVAAKRGLWLHVDAAYGGAGLAAPSVRGLFEGIERADSLVIDPHKLLFSPFDCAALLYRDPRIAQAAHTQEAAYLDDINQAAEWNPSHYAYQLTRRVRGLPFWFSLASHGTDAYRDALEAVFGLTREAAEAIRTRPYLQLALDPELSVVVFRRRGWEDRDYVEWCDRLLREQVAFSQPTTLGGERLMRFCFANPRTTLADVERVLDTMA